VSSQKKVLLADDVGFFLTLEKTFLQRQEIDILVAKNGRQAYEMIAAHHPDLALLDLYMPEMNGDECCRRIKDNPELSRIPVIMVTTAGKEEEQNRCRQAGCDEIILKPIHRRTFVETIRRFLQVIERAEPRTPVKMEIRYGQQQLLTGYSVNLSTGGLFLETNELLPADEALQLKFHLPAQDHPIACHGSVAWVNAPEAPSKPSLPTGMGIKFKDLRLDHLHQIREFLQTLEADPA